MSKDRALQTIWGDSRGIPLQEFVGCGEITIESIEERLAAVNRSELKQFMILELQRDFLQASSYRLRVDLRRSGQPGRMIKRLRDDFVSIESRLARRAQS